MSKKSMVIVGVVAAAVVVIAALLFLMPRSSSRSALTPGTDSTSNATSSTASSATSTTPPSNTSTLTSTTQGQVTTSSPNSGSGQPSDAASNGRGVSTDKLAVYAKLPDPKIPAASPTSPIPAGQTLPPLTKELKNTISAVKFGIVQTGAQYKVVLRPYGIGPSLPFGSRLAVHVDSATPVGIAPKKSPIGGHDVLVIVDTTHGGTVTKGGTYTATITFLSDGTKLRPVMTQATAK